MHVSARTSDSKLYRHCFVYTIDDTGSIVVGYTQTVYTTTEGEGMVKLCANISSPIGGIAPRPFVLNSTTFDGTAGTCTYIIICTIIISTKLEYSMNTYPAAGLRPLINPKCKCSIYLNTNYH